MTPTEYDFTLPVGFLDGDGALQREGTMRMATARDELEPLGDARVRENAAYASVLRLARVVTRLGDTAEVSPQLIEQLYTADFEHLKRMYERVNAPPPAGAGAVPARAPAGGGGARPPALAGVSETAQRWLLDEHDDAAPPGREATGFEAAASEERAWPEGVPIGLRQDRERSRARDALMRSGAPARRGRIEEGLGDGPGERAAAVALAAAREPATDGAYRPDGGSEEPAPRLMSFSPQAPDAPPLAPPASIGRRSPSPPGSLDRGPELERLCEELLARLRRELLVERERLGCLYGA